MNKEAVDRKQQARLLKLLMKMPEGGVTYEISGSRITISLQSRKFTFLKSVYSATLANGGVVDKGGYLEITDVGRVVVRQILHPDLDFKSPQKSRNHMLVSKIAGDETNIGNALQNLSESPLMRLYSRKDRNGKTYITSEELAAGEKLRSNFEKANLQPSISANWNASVTGSGSGGNQRAEMTDFVMDNRKYVETAIDCLGPELSGIALDICCFLKGLELVERERHWPPRSAKLMLKTALSILARHYGFSHKSGRESGKIEHWGEVNYRPNIGSVR